MCVIFAMLIKFSVGNNNETIIFSKSKGKKILLTEKILEHI